MTLLAILLGFLASATAVILAGVRLARDGDAIAARTRLGRLWVGSVFVAVATSLPELTTDIAAVRLGEPDLAAGDLFGSGMANMLILALVSLVPGTETFRGAALDNGISASLAISLTATAAMVVLLPYQPAVLGVGVGSLVLAAGYVVGVRAIFRSSAVARAAARVEEAAAGGSAAEEAAAVEEAAEALAAEESAAEPAMAQAGTSRGAPVEDHPSLRRAVLGFLAAAAVIVVAAPLFAASAKALAEATGLATSFVGTWLVGFATSLPELVASLAAVRIHAYDLAVGNLFGSNALNMAMFVPLDLAHGAPVLGAVSPVHALSAMVGVVLTAIGLAAIVYRAQRGFSALEPGGALMLLVYLVGIWLVYLRSSQP
jgi:cation:H+ antiporter